MNISVSIEGLLAKNLTLDEYTVLVLLNAKEFELLDKCILSEKPIISFETVDNLESKGYIKITSERLQWSKIGLRQSFYDLFDDKVLDKQFAELYNTYPMKVPDGAGGSRVLRAASVETSHGQVCKKKFMSAVKNRPELPEIMLKCLNKHLEMQRGKLQFMPGFEVWMNQKVWEKYEAFIEEVTQQEERNIDRI